MRPQVEAGVTAGEVEDRLSVGRERKEEEERRRGRGQTEQEVKVSSLLRACVILRQVWLTANWSSYGSAATNRERAAR